MNYMAGSSDTFTLVHVVESFVNFSQRLSVGDELFNLQDPVQGVFNKAWQLGSTLDTTEGRPLPDSTGDQLERSGGNFLTSGSDTDDDGLTPTLMAGFQGLSHDGDVTGTVESEVQPTVGHLDQMLNNGLTFWQLGWVDEISGANLVGPFLLVVVDVNDDDLGGLSGNSTLHDGQTDDTRTEHSNSVAFLHIGSVDSGTKVEQPMKCKISLPVALCLNLEVPSGMTPLPWVALTEPHKLVLPDLQNLHSLHSAVYKAMTESPTLTEVTPSPTDSTTPAPSWPKITGKAPSGS
ncbi:hypothetical protein WICPIJ_002341 [Wickerhamomyces pijperi]|uniref:Uncharacterized protein n=1 Tax=Wickerhamomyces pijperi TaxID=599730 RepID=A0A9P8QBY1_WICPI|nr:hypothetical protein WICPIJ_002341 [Wickerhamomyces pijperi]